MTLKNVEVIQNQDQKQPWYNRFKTKIAAVTGVTTLAVTKANAAIDAAAVTGAYTASGADGTVDAVGIIIITLAISITVVGIIIALVKKK